MVNIVNAKDVNMKRKVRPNVVSGGTAISLGDNLYYMRGKTHKQGGIDIGSNPKTGIEVENGEVVQTSPKGLRVFSAQPILNGISPANALLMGGNPNNIFNAQEAWKQANHYNDDGTKFEGGGYTPSKEIIDYIKKTEGFRDKWYKDGNGIDTIGYGFTGSRIKKLYPNGITREQADKEFADSIAKRALILAKDTPNWNKLSQSQRDALLSYHYNVGEGSYRNKHKKLQQALADSDWENVMLNMDAGYNDKKNPGLRARRDYERELFKSGMIASLTGDEEKAFRTWYDRYSRSQNLDPNPDAKEHYYDYRTYWKNRTPEQKNDEWKLGNHLPDTYKKPGHPTFSTESIYSTRKTPGGTWKQVGLGPVYDEQFVDSKYTKNLRKYQNVSFALGGDDFKTIRQRKDYIPTKFQKWIQDKIGPLHYPNPVGVHGDFSRFYFGRPTKNNTFYMSRYKPSKSKNKDTIYYGVKSPAFLNDLIHLYNNRPNIDLLKSEGNQVIDGYQARITSERDDRYVGNNIERYYPFGDLRKKGLLPPKIGSKDYMLSDSVAALGNFTIGRGKDEKGEYLSYYDLWDVNTKTDIEKRGLAKPYEIYDRIYGTFDDNGTFHPNGEIEPSIISEKLKYGGIHIKPSKRGTFTAAAKRHHMGVQEFARTVLNNRARYSAAMVKKANFARNASKWHKKELGGDMTKQYYITKDNIYSLGGNVRPKAELGTIRPQRYYDNGTVYYKLGDKTFTKEEFANVYGLNVNDIDTKFDFDDLTYIPKYTKNSNVPIKVFPTTSIDISKNQPKFNETFLSAFPNPNYSLGIADKSSPKLSELPGGTISSTGNTPRNPYYSRLNIGLHKAGNYIKNNPDIIGLGVNLTGNLAASLINRSAIKGMKYAPAPIPISAQKLPTEVNIEPQVSSIKENVAGQERLIADNTADSRVALARRQRVRNQGAQQYQTLFGNKLNTELQLLTADRLNRQGVDAQNVGQYNQWRNGLYDFENRRKEMLAENSVAGINNAAEAIAGERGYLARREARKQNLLNMGLIAATSPNAQNVIGSEEFEKFLRSIGYDGNFSLLRKRLKG